MLQREAERIDAHMAARASRVPLMRSQFLFQSETAEHFIVRRNGSSVGRRRRHRRAEHAAQNPISTLHRAGAERRGRGRKHCPEAKESTTLEAVRALDEFDTVFRFDLSLHSVELGQRLVKERIVGKQHLANGPILSEDVFEEGHRFIVHGFFHFIRELGEAAGIDSLEFIEMIEPEPLAEEFR